MGKITLSALLLIITLNLRGQEIFKKNYKINSNALFMGKSGGQKKYVYLMQDCVVKYKDLDDAERKAIDLKYPIGTEVEVTDEIVFQTKKTNTVRKYVIDRAFLDSISITKPELVSLNSCSQSTVLFEGDKVFVNVYLRKEGDKLIDEGIYYYKLKNRQSIFLYFSEFTVSALTVPIKYRFKGSGGLKEEFSTTINGNAFFGYSYGRTSFFYQEKVGNKSNTAKFTGGLLMGASTVTLNHSNTSQNAEPLGEDVEIIKGLASVGFGISFSYNKINLGGFYGYDYAIGDEASKWNYNKKPWLGIAIGYSLFNFGS